MTSWNSIFIAFFSLTLSLVLFLLEQLTNNKLACCSNMASGIESDDCHHRTTLFVRDKLTSRDHRSSTGSTRFLLFPPTLAVYCSRCWNQCFANACHLPICHVFATTPVEWEGKSSVKKSITEAIFLFSLPGQPYPKRKKKKPFASFDGRHYCDLWLPRMRLGEEQEEKLWHISVAFFLHVVCRWCILLSHTHIAYVNIDKRKRGRDGYR